ncbi:MAG: sulfatase [Rubripirellula sp.]
MFRNVLAIVLLFFCIISLSVAAESAEPKIKNVLFLIADDLRASVLGCYGDRFCQTPNIDSLAQRGMLFSKAYCQGTSCAPSRQSMMFSRYQGASEVNLGQHFREQGWYSARVGKIYHMRVPGDIIAGTNGLDVESTWTERFNSPGLEAHTPGEYACLNLNEFSESLVNRQSTKMPHRMFVSVKYDGDGSDQADHKAASKAIELLGKHAHEKFFLAVGFVRPHYPMVAPRQFFEPYPWQQMILPPQQTGDLDDIPKLGLAATISSRNPIGMYPDNQKRMWSAYYAAVSFMDEQVGRVLDELDRLGLRETTAVVFTSDHGYHLGDHQFWQKSNLHEQVLRVPLIISSPGLEPGRSESIVELVDLFPTLSELAGLDIPASVQGKSLLPILRDPEASVKQYAMSFHRGHSIRSKQWHYMKYQDGSRELYDVVKDPGEFDNLAIDDESSALVSRFDEDLSRLLKEYELTVDNDRARRKGKRDAR